MYQVVDTNTHESVEDGFATRESAKVKRDKMNGGKPEADEMPRYIVARGIAHPKGPSFGISTRERGKNSRWL